MRNNIEIEEREQQNKYKHTKKITHRDISDTSAAHVFSGVQIAKCYTHIKYVKITLAITEHTRSVPFIFVIVLYVCVWVSYVSHITNKCQQSFVHTNNVKKKEKKK